MILNLALNHNLFLKPQKSKIKSKIKIKIMKNNFRILCVT